MRHVVGVPFAVDRDSRTSGVRIALAPNLKDHPMLSVIIRLIFSFLLPPVAVALKRGIGLSFVFSIILTLLAWVPGVIYALYVNFLAD